MPIYQLRNELQNADAGGTWTLISYPIVFIDDMDDICHSNCESDNPAIDTDGIPPGEYVFEYNIGDGNCADVSTVTLNVYEKPIVTEFPTYAEFCTICNTNDFPYTITPVILKSSDNQPWDELTDGVLRFQWTVTGIPVGLSGVCSFGSGNFTLNGTNNTDEATELIITDLPSCAAGTCQLGLGVFRDYDDVSCATAGVLLGWCKHLNICAGDVVNLHTCDLWDNEIDEIDLMTAVSNEILPVNDSISYIKLVQQIEGNLPGYDDGDILLSTIINFLDLNDGDEFTFIHVVEYFEPTGDACISESDPFTLTICKINTGNAVEVMFCLNNE